jgi:hypothetical protein
MGFAGKKDSEKGNGDENRAKTLNFEKSNSLNSSLNPKPSQQRGAYAAFGQHPDRSRAEEPVREGKSGGRAGRTTRRAPRRSPAPMCCDPRRPRVYPGRHQRPPGAGSTFEFPRLECREAGSIHSTAWGARPARRGLPCPRRGPRGARPYSRAW